LLDVSAKVQNPPRAAPRRARPNSITTKVGANALTALDDASNAVRTTRIVRRSIRLAPTTSAGAAAAATRPGKVTMRPAVPDETARSFAIWGKRPIGRNSVVTNANAPRAIEVTLSHGRREGEDASTSCVSTGEEIAEAAVMGSSVMTLSVSL